MKVKLTKAYQDADGIHRPGEILDVAKKEAKWMFDNSIAVGEKDPVPERRRPIATKNAVKSPPASAAAESGDDLSSESESGEGSKDSREAAIAQLVLMDSIDNETAELLVDNGFVDINSLKAARSENLVALIGQDKTDAISQEIESFDG